MPSMTASQAQRSFGKTLEAATEAPVEITRHGVVIAAIVSPEVLAEYRRFREFAVHGCIAEGLQKAVALMNAGDSARGLGLLRALVPYWREAGLKSARKR